MIPWTKAGQHGVLTAWPMTSHGIHNISLLENRHVLQRHFGIKQKKRPPTPPNAHLAPQPGQPRPAHVRVVDTIGTGFCLGGEES